MWAAVSGFVDVQAAQQGGHAECDGWFTWNEQTKLCTSRPTEAVDVATSCRSVVARFLDCSERIERRHASSLVVAQAQGGVSFVPKGPAGGEPTKAGKLATARAVEVSGDKSRTTFALSLSKGVTVEIFTLAEPYRVVIDLPEVEFQLPGEAGQVGAGVVTAFRYGLFDAGQSRIVMDTSVPVKINGARMHQMADGGVRLDVVLIPTDPTSFGGGTGGQRSARSTKANQRVGGVDGPPKSRERERADRVAAAGKAAGTNGNVERGEAASGPANTAVPGDWQAKVNVPAADQAEESKPKKPVVMIDPGHGGVDPGTVGANNVREKVVVLAVGKRLAELLKKTGRYDVRMTRTTDKFVSLNKRLKMSRDAKADLFISLHADAISQKSFAESVRGATVYTLSETASDAQARRLAEKENSVDLAAGMQSDADKSEKGLVKDILIDLLKRETANFSADFSKELVHRLKRTMTVSRVPQRSAAFKVLKQTYSPSVLVELGYLSNSSDAKSMSSKQWRERMAKSIAAAVESYFKRRRAARDGQNGPK